VAKPKTQKQETEIVIEEIKNTINTINTGLVMFRFNRNVNIGGILVKNGACLEVKRSDAEDFEKLNVGEILGEILKVGE
jgi:hypothetical protein